MSIKTQIMNLRADLKVRQERANAQVQAAYESLRATPMFGVMFALAFVAMLTALGVGAPASAEAINLSGISDVITGFTAIIPDLMALIVAIIPMVFTLAIYSFILGLLAAILGLIKVNL
jgi:hypothetical protein